MSYKLSRRVFSLDISSTEKLVLRALADRANDDGSSCYPSVLTLAKETSLSRKTVQTTLGSLKGKGLVVVVGQSKGGRGKTPEYQLRFPKVDQKSNRETHRKGVRATPFSKNKGRNCVPERAKLRPVKGVTASPDSVLDSVHDSGGSPGSPPLGGPIHLSQDQGTSQSSSSVPGKAPAKKNDDDSPVSPDAPDRIELLLEKAKTILVSRGHERDFVEKALEFIEQRAVDCGKAPATVQYYLTSFETLERSSEERNLVRDLVEKRRARYAKFGMPLDPTTLRLNPEQEEARRAFNEGHRGTPVQPDSKNESSDVQPEPPTKTEPTPNGPAPVSSDASTLTCDDAEDLLFYAEHYRANDSYETFERARKLVHRKFVRFANHTGEFRSEERRREFVDHIHRLSDRKQANDAKRASRNQRRRELRKQRHPTRSNRPRKKARK